MDIETARGPQAPEESLLLNDFTTPRKKGNQNSKLIKEQTNSLDGDNITLNTLIDIPEDQSQLNLNRSLDQGTKLLPFEDHKESKNGGGQQMKIEINHRPHQNFRKRNFIKQNRQSVKAISKMLSPIIKSKYQLPINGQDAQPQFKEAEKIEFGFSNQKANRSKLKNNQLRNSGTNELDLMSQSIDAWSMSNQNMSKEKLNETVRSDEFINSKLYTNTQKIQVIDLLDHQNKNEGRNQIFNPAKGNSLVSDGGYSSPYNTNLMKTTNSFFPRNSEMEKQLKIQMSGIKPNRNQVSPTQDQQKFSLSYGKKQGALDFMNLADQKVLPPLRNKPKKFLNQNYGGHDGLMVNLGNINSLNGIQSKGGVSINKNKTAHQQIQILHQVKQQQNKIQQETIQKTPNYLTGPFGSSIKRKKGEIRMNKHRASPSLMNSSSDEANNSSLERVLSNSFQNKGKNNINISSMPRKNNISVISSQENNNNFRGTHATAFNNFSNSMKKEDIIQIENNYGKNNATQNSLEEIVSLLPNEKKDKKKKKKQNGNDRQMQNSINRNEGIQSPQRIYQIYNPSNLSSQNVSHLSNRMNYRLGDKFNQQHGSKFSYKKGAKSNFLNQSMKIEKKHEQPHTQVLVSPRSPRVHSNAVDKTGLLIDDGLIQLNIEQKRALNQSNSLDKCQKIATDFIQINENIPQNTNPINVNKKEEFLRFQEIKRPEGPKLDDPTEQRRASVIYDADQGLNSRKSQVREENYKSQFNDMKINNNKFMQQKQPSLSRPVTRGNSSGVKSRANKSRGGQVLDSSAPRMMDNPNNGFSQIRSSQQQSSEVEKSSGYQDQFNIPSHIVNRKAPMDIKIVPFGDFGGSIGSPVRDNRNTQKMQELQSTSSKRVGSRGIISRGGRPQIQPKPLNSDPMQPQMPKYSYTEERPQTRGNTTHVQTAGGTRGGRRQVRAPSNQVLDALSGSGKNSMVKFSNYKGSTQGGIQVTTQESNMNDQFNMNSGRDFSKHSPQIKGKVTTNLKKFNIQAFQNFEQYGLIQPEYMNAPKVLSPAQVNFAPGIQKERKAPTMVQKSANNVHMNVESGLGQANLVPRTTQPFEDGLGATQPQYGQMPIDFDSGNQIMDQSDSITHEGGTVHDRRRTQQSSFPSTFPPSSHATNDRTNVDNSKTSKDRTVNRLPEHAPYLEQVSKKLNQQASYGNHFE